MRLLLTISKSLFRAFPFGSLILALAVVFSFTACKKEKKTPKKPKAPPVSKATPTPTPTPAPTPVIVPGAVYFLSNPDGPNSVVAFRRNSSTGFISYLGFFPSGGNGTTAIQGDQAHAVLARGSFLYAVNSGSNTFSVFRLGTDARPTLLSTISSNGTRPVSIAIHGNLLFVLNQGIPAGDGGPFDGGLAGFLIGADGIPVPIPGSTQTFDSADMPSDVFFTGNGQRLAVLRSGANAVTSFDVAADGVLSSPQSIDVGSQPVGGTATARLPWTGFAAVVEEPGAASVVSFTTNSTLAIVSQILAPDDIDPCWTVASVDGLRLWTSNFKPQSLTLYDISADSSLTKKGAYAPAPDPTAPGALDVDVSSDGRFLYRLRAFNADGSPTPPHPFPIVEVFQIQSGNANGGLSLIQSVEVQVNSLRDASPTGMAVAAP